MPFEVRGKTENVFCVYYEHLFACVCMCFCGKLHFKMHMNAHGYTVGSLFVPGARPVNYISRKKPRAAFGTAATLAPESCRESKRFFPHNNMCRELWATNTSLFSENFHQPASSAAHQIKLWWFFIEFVIHTNTEQEVQYRKHIHMYTVQSC